MDMMGYSVEDFITDNGRFTTKSLFLEKTIPAQNRHLAVFTLRDDDRVVDGKTYYSLKKLYLAMEDVHEYTFATTYLHGWKHWKTMCATAELIPHITEWREELALKIRCQGFKEMKKLSEGGDRTASKYLADKGWDEQSGKRGRPSKEEVAKERKQLAAIQGELEDDFARMVQ
jgi:hypothetical protein